MSKAQDIAKAGLKISDDLLVAAKCKAVVNAEKDKRKDAVLAVTDFVVHTVSVKGCKVDTSIHVLDLVALKTTRFNSEQAIVFVTADQELLLTNVELDPKTLMRVIYTLLRQIFPHASLSNIISTNIAIPIPEVSSEPKQACDGFVSMFRIACSYHGIRPSFPGLEEIINRYQATRQRDFLADDFHLCMDEVAPALITTLHHNSWFTSLTIQDVKLAPETLDALVALVRRTCHIQGIKLNRIHADARFWSRFCRSLGENKRQSISSIDISENSIGESVIIELAGSIEKLVLGTRVLHLASVGMTTKSAIALSKGIAGNKRSTTSLQVLDIANNPIGQDGASALLELLKGANVVNEINLSNTNSFLEPILTTLSASIFEHLSVLSLGDCKFSPKKLTRLQPNTAAVFQRCPCLASLNFSGCKFSKEFLQVLLDGLASNPLLSNLTLSLSKCDLGCEDGYVNTLHLYFPRLPCLAALDLSSNDFSDTQLAKIIGSASSNSKTLKHLNLSSNLGKAKSLDQTIMALRTLFEGSIGMSHLDLSNLKLKQDLLKALPSLGHNSTIKSLNLAGNCLGDGGIREVATMLQYNKTLEELVLEDNNIGEIGFRELAAALQVNKTLRYMPFPLADITSLFGKASPKLISALRNIEKSLAQNHSPSRHINVTKDTARTDGTATKGRLLSTLVDQVSTICEDGPLKEEALNNASASIQASGTIRNVQRELEDNIMAELARKFADFGGSLAASLSVMLGSSVEELYAATEAASGSSLEDLFRPTTEDHDSLCRELVTTAVVDLACNHVMSMSAQQVIAASENVTNFVLSNAIQQLRAALIARDASGCENIEELPEIKRARQQSTGVKAKHLTMSLDAKNEAPISFEIPPADAGAASRNPQLQHVAKARPRHAGRRPPSRQHRIELANSMDPAFGNVSPDRSESKDSNEQESPRVAMRPPPPSRVPPKRSSALDFDVDQSVDEDNFNDGEATEALAPRPKPRPTPPSRPPLTKSQSALFERDVKNALLSRFGSQDTLSVHSSPPKTPSAPTSKRSSAIGDPDRLAGVSELSESGNEPPKGVTGGVRVLIPPTALVRSSKLQSQLMETNKNEPESNHDEQSDTTKSSEASITPKADSKEEPARGAGMDEVARVSEVDSSSTRVNADDTSTSASSAHRIQKTDPSNIQDLKAQDDQKLSTQSDIHTDNISTDSAPCVEKNDDKVNIYSETSTDTSPANVEANLHRNEDVASSKESFTKEEGVQDCPPDAQDTETIISENTVDTEATSSNTTDKKNTADTSNIDSTYMDLPNDEVVSETLNLDTDNQHTDNTNSTTVTKQASVCMSESHVDNILPLNQDNSTQFPSEPPVKVDVEPLSANKGFSQTNGNDPSIPPDEAARADEGLPPPPSTVFSTDVDDTANKETTVKADEDCSPPPVGKQLSDTSLYGESLVDTQPQTLVQKQRSSADISTDDAWQDAPALNVSQPQQPPVTKPRPAAKPGAPPPPKPKPKTRPAVVPKNTS